MDMKLLLSTMMSRSTSASIPICSSKVSLTRRLVEVQFVSGYQKCVLFLMGWVGGVGWHPGKVNQLSPTPCVSF